MQSIECYQTRFSKSIVGKWIFASSYDSLGVINYQQGNLDLAIDYYEKVLGFTEDEVEGDFEHMNQYYHKLMDSYPDSLLKAKEKAEKYLKKDYKKTRRETTL